MATVYDTIDAFLVQLNADFDARVSDIIVEDGITLRARIRVEKVEIEREAMNDLVQRVRDTYAANDVMDENDTTSYADFYA